MARPIVASSKPESITAFVTSSKLGIFSCLIVCLRTFSLIRSLFLCPSIEDLKLLPASSFIVSSLLEFATKGSDGICLRIISRPNMPAIFPVSKQSANTLGLFESKTPSLHGREPERNHLLSCSKTLWKDSRRGGPVENRHVLFQKQRRYFDH